MIALASFCNSIVIEYYGDRNRVCQSFKVWLYLCFIAESNTPTHKTGIDDITGVLKQRKPSLCWRNRQILGRNFGGDIS